ncbi:MAG: hypothetical protein WKG01_17510 [Kofleriaceae bacterium]
MIVGQAYGRRATLELAGDTLTWRALRGVAENICTTVHDVRNPRWIEMRWSRAGFAIALLGAFWAVRESLWIGLATLGAAIALVVWRRLHPRYFLAFDAGDRRLILRVEAGSAAPAKALAARIESTLASGELPATPPMLP